MVLGDVVDVPQAGRADLWRTRVVPEPAVRRRVDRDAVVVAEQGDAVAFKVSAEAVGSGVVESRRGRTPLQTTQRPYTPDNHQGYSLDRLVRPTAAGAPSTR